MLKAPLNCSAYDFQTSWLGLGEPACTVEWKDTGEGLAATAIEMEEALAAKFGLGADLMFNDFAENGLCFTVGEGWTSGIPNAHFNLVLGILVAILFIVKDAIEMLEADYWGMQQSIMQIRHIALRCRLILFQTDLSTATVRLPTVSRRCILCDRTADPVARLVVVHCSVLHLLCRLLCSASRCYGGEYCGELPDMVRNWRMKQQHFNTKKSAIYILLCL